MLRLVVTIPLVGGIFLWLCYEISRAIRTRLANASGILISGRTNIWLFWLILAVQFGFAFAAAVLLVRLLREVAAQPA